MAQSRQLARVRVGSKGLTARVLDEIGIQLQLKELVRVSEVNDAGQWGWVRVSGKEEENGR